jgi:ABC-type transport system substrate-binding protein
MASRTFHRLTWRIGLCLVVSLPWLVVAQQATKSDADLAQQGALALAMAHGDKPRYGGKFLSVGNEEVPFYDMHQTSLGGIYAAVAPAYNCLIRTSPYDPKGQEIMPELADAWEVSDGGKTLTSHLHKGVKWHDGAPFSSADVKYTIERIMPPPGHGESPRASVQCPHRTRRGA